MRKVTFILGLVLLISGCSAFRIASNKNNLSTINLSADEILKSIKNKNLTSGSFYIRKAEFKILSEEGTESGLGSVKFEFPDKFLISIKSVGGVEAARIFVTKDTVLINDRINRKLYYGSSKYLKTKYGITADIFPLVIGDYLNENVIRGNEILCEDGKFHIRGEVKGIGIKYVIDCKSGKSILAVPEKNSNEVELEIRYDNFLDEGDIITPGRIKITDSYSKTTIEIRIHNIESPWEGSVEFIPGNRYELIKLL